MCLTVIVEGFRGVLACRSVLLSFERACAFCHKRIGNTAFTLYPDGRLAHYSCYQHAEGMVIPDSRGFSWQKNSIAAVAIHEL